MVLPSTAIFPTLKAYHKSPLVSPLCIPLCIDRLQIKRPAKNSCRVGQRLCASSSKHTQSPQATWGHPTLTWWLFQTLPNFHSRSLWLIHLRERIQPFKATASKLHPTRAHQQSLHGPWVKYLEVGEGTQKRLPWKFYEMLASVSTNSSLTELSHAHTLRYWPRLHLQSS